MNATTADQLRLLRVTAGNLRQSHLYVAGHLDFFPKDAVGGSRRDSDRQAGIEIILDGLNTTVVTDIGSDAKTGKPRGFLRGRGWVRNFYEHHKIKPGSLVGLERLADRRYRLRVEPDNGTPTVRSANVRDRRLTNSPTGEDTKQDVAGKTGQEKRETAQSLFANRFTGPLWPDHFGEWLANWSNRKLSEPIRTVSLFTGAGGLDIGFHQAGFHAIEMVEFDERFVPTLEANCGMFGMFGDAVPRHVDVRKYDPKNIGKIDFIIGGPPCQTFSAAGRRAGGVIGTTDERGQLFMAYVDLLKRLKPRGFLFENVYGITGANGGRDWAEIRAAFVAAGYHVHHRVLDSADYGVPQHRERMFIVGMRRGAFRFPRPTHGPDSPGGLPHYSAGTAVEGVPNEQRGEPSQVNGRYGHLLAEIPAGLNYSYFTERMNHPRPLFAWRSKFSDFLYKADPARPVRTIKAQGGQYTGPFHWENRPFTTSELKRLQTFPDKYQIRGGRATVIQQIGNSVPPQLARILAIAILEQVFGVETPLDLPLLEPGVDLGFRSRKRELTHYYSELACAEKPRQASASAATITARTRRVALTEDFRLVERAKHEDGISVLFQPTGRTWRFLVGNSEPESASKRFVVTARPRSGAVWPLPCDEVILEGSSLDPSKFTISWKVFEAELQRQDIKADLVQLSGYYQYEPGFVAEMSVKGRTPWMWRALSEVVQGKGTRGVLPTDSIASEWGIEADQVREFAQFLRLLGFEVRNHNTNPQIPGGHWLLPYAFPTLSHQSVQLRKELGK